VGNVAAVNRQLVHEVPFVLVVVADEDRAFEGFLQPRNDFAALLVKAQVLVAQHPLRLAVQRELLAMDDRGDLPGAHESIEQIVVEPRVRTVLRDLSERRGCAAEGQSGHGNRGNHSWKVHAVLLIADDGAATLSTDDRIHLRKGLVST
jgi:hypothetical protein